MRILQELLGYFLWIMLPSALPLLALAYGGKRVGRTLKLTLALSVLLCNAALVVWFLHQVDSHYRNAFYRWNLNCLAEQFETAGDQELFRSLEELEQNPRVMWKKRTTQR